MKTLKIIQTLSKIGKVISKIVFIFCIVGFCGCIVGIISLTIGADMLKLGDVTIHGIIENNAGMSIPSMYAAMSVGMVFCAAGSVLAKFAETYFKNELADGDPFTLRGAKELMRLGILNIAISMSTVIACSIGVGIAAHFFPDIVKLDLGGFSSVGLGIAMIVLSLFCRYGAEIREEKSED